MKEIDNIKKSQIVLYKSGDSSVAVEVYLKDDTFWMTQKAMSKLFDCSVDNISLHLKNIYDTEELNKDSTIEESSVVQKEGSREVKRVTKLYHLDAVIAVGYRVNSKKATKFRQWATKVLNEYIRKGYALDDNRLKELGGGGYFKELLERIRDIRASEKVFYRQVLEIFATSYDYDPNSKLAKEFFSKVQNKIHYAIHGNTASELIDQRVDAEKDFMGLMSFSGEKPSLEEAKIAKNYLNEDELKSMGQLVSGYLDLAERQAQREILMNMADWTKHLDNILVFSGEQLLKDAGSVSHKKAMHKVEEKYKKYSNKTLSTAEKDYLNSVNRLKKIN